MKIRQIRMTDAISVTLAILGGTTAVIGAWLNANITVAAWIGASFLALLLSAYLAGVLAWHVRDARRTRLHHLNDCERLKELSALTVVVTTINGTQERYSATDLPMLAPAVWIAPISVAMYRQLGTPDDRIVFSVRGRG